MKMNFNIHYHPTLQGSFLTIHHHMVNDVLTIGCRHAGDIIAYHTLSYVIISHHIMAYYPDSPVLYNIYLTSRCKKTTHLKYIQMQKGYERIINDQSLQIFRIHASFESRCIPEKCIQITNVSLHLSLSLTVNVCIPYICIRNAATAALAAHTVPAHLFHTNIAKALQSLVRQKSYLDAVNILIVIYMIVIEKN